MATRKIKIGLSTTDITKTANATIWIDDILMQDNISVNAAMASPMQVEYTFDAGTTITLKVRLNNDYYNEPEDLNLCINYICLSDEDGIYTPYTYLLAGLDNNRTDDNTYLVTKMLWAAGDELILTIDVTAQPIWFDYYQYNLDNL